MSYFSASSLHNPGMALFQPEASAEENWGVSVDLRTMFSCTGHAADEAHFIPVFRDVGDALKIKPLG